MDNRQGFCWNCGQPVASGQGFCASCGAAQQQPTQQPEQQQFVQQQPAQQMQPLQPTSQVAQPQMPIQAVPQQTFSDGASVVGGAKRRKKILLASLGGALAVALIAIIAVVAVGLSGGKDRTLMVYMIGSNLESEASAASLDITEMMEADFGAEHTKVLVYTGGTKSWALDEISADENAIFEIRDGKLDKVQTYEKATMTDPVVLTEFVNYAYANYPADLYDLVLWDHGGGPIVGYGLDENSLIKSPMKINTLAGALAETNLVKSGKKFDLIGFDACLMGSLETAVALEDYANYMIASEEVEPGWGWNYDFLSSLGVGTLETEELGKSVIDKFMTHYDNYAYDVDLSLSMTDLRKLDKLQVGVGDLFTKVKGEINQRTFSDYSRLMTREKVYGYTGRDSESYDLVDLVDLAGSLESDYPEDVQQIRNNLAAAVVYSASNMDNTNGLSMYFLNFNKAEAEQMLAAYKEVAFSDEYYDFLVKYQNFVSGSPMVSRSVYSDLPEEKTDARISVELTDELAENYQSGEILIFRKLGDNKFMPVYRSSEVELNDKTLQAASYDLQFVVEYKEDGETQYGWITLMEKERTSRYVDYVTYGVLYYDDAESIIGFSPKSYEAYLRLPAGSDTATVRDIRVAADAETGLASKVSFDSARIKWMDFVAGTYKLFDENGVQNDSFESYGQLYGTEVNLEEGDEWAVKLVGLDFDFGDMYDGEIPAAMAKDYWAEFIVHDTQGNSHRLNLIHID